MKNEFWFFFRFRFTFSFLIDSKGLMRFYFFIIIYSLITNSALFIVTFNLRFHWSWSYLCKTLIWLPEIYSINKRICIAFYEQNNDNWNFFWLLSSKISNVPLHLLRIALPNNLQSFSIIHFFIINQSQGLNGQVLTQVLVWRERNCLRLLSRDF